MPGRWQLVLVWGLFAAWVGWLGWQAIRAREFPVVSRAQLLNANAVVVVEVTLDADGRALAEGRIVEVLWPIAKSETLTVGSILPISNLPQTGVKAGIYVVPLHGVGPHKIAELPRSPLVDPGRFKPQIYRDGTEVRQQVAEFFQGR